MRCRRDLPGEESGDQPLPLWHLSCLKGKRLAKARVGPPAARRFVETSYDRAADFAAAVNHDRAGRQMTPDRLAPVSEISAPALVIHGADDPLRPLPHGQALAAGIPHARLETVPGMGHGFFSPGLPRHVGQRILGHTQSSPPGGI